MRYRTKEDYDFTPPATAVIAPAPRHVSLLSRCALKYAVVISAVFTEEREYDIMEKKPVQFS